MDRENNAAIANTLYRQTLLAIRQVLGEQGAKDIYHAAKLDAYLNKLPPDNLQRTLSAIEYANLMQIIETTYREEGPSILRRIGKASFHVILREQPSWMSTAKRVLSLWVSGNRAQFMLEAIVDAQRKTYPNTEIWMEEKNGGLAYIDQNCLVCYGRQSSHTVCHLTSGYLREAIQWATEMEFEVQETDCIAKGDAYCRFKIVKGYSST
jgi:predicted hydrocarbon binding protein